MTLQACPRCADLRAAGEWAQALRCHRCEGKGIRTDPRSVLCNGCGGSLCIKDGGDNDGSTYGLVNQTVAGHFSSYHLMDTITYTFSLCEQCLRKMFDGFKMPPKLGCYMGEAPESYAEERGWYTDRLWRSTGADLDRLRQGLCNATVECKEPAAYRTFRCGALSNVALCEGHKMHEANDLGTLMVGFDQVSPQPGYVRDGQEPKPMLERLRILRAWALAKRPRALGETANPLVAVLHKYLPNCLQDVMEIDDSRDSKFSCIWFPTPMAAAIQEVQQASQWSQLFAEGSLLVFDRNHVVELLLNRTWACVDADKRRHEELRAEYADGH